MKKIIRNPDLRFIEKAVKEAQRSQKKQEVPVGAVIVKNNTVIARAHNGIETNNDATAHAEIIAIRTAGKNTGNWRLAGSTLYVTVEPCAMCLAAIYLARIRRVVFGCVSFNKMYAANTFKGLEVAQIQDLSIQKKCQALMKTFFKNARHPKRSVYGKKSRKSAEKRR